MEGEEDVGGSSSPQGELSGAGRASASPKKRTPYSRFSSKRHATRDASVLREEPKTGIPVSREEVEAAFEFFDTSGKKVLKPKDLKAKLSAFYPTLSNKEYRFLISEPEFTVDTLMKLLENNDLSNFDPVREAFKVYDPDETGYLNPTILKEIMTNLGYGEITEEDMEVLVKAADVDGDGQVSLEDFRRMLDWNKEKDAKQEMEKSGEL